MEEYNLDNDDLLMYRMVEIENNAFCFQVKESSHMQYFLISQNNSSILFPTSGTASFLEALDFFCSNYVEQKEEEEEEEEGVNKQKELKINDKAFYFNAGKDDSGQFLKISEASARANCGNLIIPCGENKNNGLELFRATVAEFKRTLSVFFPPRQEDTVVNVSTQQWQHASAPPEQLVEVTDAKSTFSASHSAQSSSASQSNIELPHHDQSRGSRNFRMMKVEGKQFFFDFGSNMKGHYLKISEVADGHRYYITIPLSGLKQFYEMVGHFLETAKGSDSESNEGLETSKNVMQ